MGTKPAKLPISSTECRYGLMSYLSGDDPIGRSLSEYGEWAQQEIEFLCSFIGLGSTVIDVGANVGTHTLAFSRRVGPSGRVIAFEPQPIIFGMLHGNLERNSCRNVTAYNKAIGKKVGELNLPLVDYAGHLNSGAVSLRKRPADVVGRAIPVVPLDDIPLQALHLVKVDAEGMERDVICGMSAVINRHRPVIFCECNDVAAASDLFIDLPLPNYCYFLTRTIVFNSSNHLENADNIFGFATETNLLLVPDELVSNIPSNIRGVHVARVQTMDDLAIEILTAPRFGDKTSFARDTQRLSKELTDRETEIIGLRLTVDELSAENDFRSKEIAKLAAELETAKDVHSEWLQLNDRQTLLAAKLADAEMRADEIRRSVECISTESDETRSKASLVAASEFKVDDLERSLDHVIAEREESIRENARLVAELAITRDIQLEFLQLSDRHTALVARCTDFELKVDELAGVLDRFSVERDDLSLANSTLRTELEKVEQMHSEAERQNAALTLQVLTAKSDQEEIRKLATELERLKNDYEKEQKTNEELNRDLSALRADVERIEFRNENLANQMRQAQQLTEERQAQVDVLSSQLALLTVSLASARDDLASKTSLLDAAISDRAAAVSEIEALRGRLSNETRAVEDLSREVFLLRTSTSWKFTHPFRVISSLMRPRG